MQARECHRLNAYLNPARSGADRQLLARLRADRARGVGYSETVRRALTHYYEHRDRPAPTPADALALLSESVAALQRQVEALTQQVAAWHQQTAQLHAENAHLQLALVQLAYGDRQMQQAGRAVANHALAALSAGSGNGNGANGHD
jgi:hypothetical protein